MYDADQKKKKKCRAGIGFMMAIN